MACCGAPASTAYTKTLASSTPGSTDIVVDVPTVQAAACAEMPDGEWWSIAVGCGCRQFARIVQEPLQKSVNRETLLLGCRSQASFGFRRDIETHWVVLLFLGYRTSARQSAPPLPRDHRRLAARQRLKSATSSSSVTPFAASTASSCAAASLSAVRSASERLGSAGMKSPMVSPCRVMATGVSLSSKYEARFSRNSRIPTVIGSMDECSCVQAAVLIHSVQDAIAFIAKNGLGRRLPPSQFDASRRYAVIHHRFY